MILDSLENYQEEEIPETLNLLPEKETQDKPPGVEEEEAPLKEEKEPWKCYLPGGWKK